LPKLSREKIIETIKIEGKENLDDALKEGKGVVGVGAHFGNFPLLCARLAAEGYPFSVIARHPRDKNLARFFSDLRDKMGIGFISDKPPGVCIRDSLACLKRNKILYLQIDLNVSSGGGKVYVDFFGKTVPTPTGPVSLAMRSGSPILPMFIVRDSEISHKIFIEPSVDLELSGDKGRDISVNIARLTKIIESYVRKYPTQWWWLHQRWRKAL
jgi:KDO2-lipid IV(A) lauroyltransferase